ncbi:hypothetical protein [Stappia sp.]|uniref:hypothetical protein n=1 Tax=Stappia sp. TaxID=1870903 RepID=UPI003A99FFEA
MLDVTRWARILHTLSVGWVSISILGAATATSYFAILLLVIALFFVLSMYFDSLALCAANFCLVVIWCVSVILFLAELFWQKWTFSFVFVLPPACLSTLGLFVLLRAMERKSDAS